MIRQRLVLFLLLLATVASAQETAPVSVGERQLFLDDQGIAKIDGLQRTLHQPEKRGAVIKPDQPWETTLQTRSSPVWDEQAKQYKLWLITSTPAPGVAGTTYAESVDGVKWTKPILRQGKYQDSLENNFVAVEPDSAWPANAILNIVYDPDDVDPQRRFKGFLGAIGRQPIVSPDGIHWKKLDVPVLPSSDESNLSYDRQSRTFIATLKTGGPFGRSHGIWTSKDFNTWTNTGVVFSADAEDQTLGRRNIEQCFADSARRHPEYNIPDTYNVDVYNLGLFRYEGLYLAMPAMFHRTGQVSKDWDGFDKMELSAAILGEVRKYGDWTGFHHAQLACSRDLHSWTRLGNRQPFLDLSPLAGGAYDTQVIMPPSNAVVHGDELWFYYTGIKGYAYVSSGKPETSGGAICLAVLRRDGFVSLDAGETPGTITSKPFKWSGSKLMANVETRDRGELRAEVLDTAGEVIATSQPLKGNHPRGEFRWSQALPKSLHGRQVSLRFTLREASFYAWWAE